jgi:prefoldin subunit 5
MMIEESETPDAGSKADVAGDVLAERRARHADPAVIRRAEAAEAVARNLETHLAALEQRIEEVGRERERVAQQLAERETDVRSVKQREYAEQQLRVEAEERSERLQREMRTQIQELSTRLQETERHVQELKVELTQLRERDARLTPIVRELMDVAAGLRAGFERELTTLREELQQQVVWERETYVRELTAMGARMEDLRFELTRTAADLRAQLSAEPLNPSLLEHTTDPQSEREAAHRREMADALVAAVERLRARVAEVKEAEAQIPDAVEDLASEPVETDVEPQAQEPGPVVAEPEPEPEPVAVEPEVVVEASEPVVAEPEPESVAGEPEAVVGEPEPMEAESDPLAVESEAVVEAPGPEPVVLEPEPAAAEPEPEPVAVEPEVAAEEPEPTLVEEEPAGEEAVEGLAAPVAAVERLAPDEPAVEGLGPGATLGTKTVTTEPIALQSRLLSVPDKRLSWLAPAIRRLAAQRDAKLAAELVIELIPAQRELVEAPLSYEIKIGELGTFYVTLEPGQATISREPRGAVDFSLEGPVAAFSELAAGGVGRRYPGLRMRKGKRRARRFLKARRRPVALADLAAIGVDVWPGLLLLAMAEAIDASWTSGRRFELAFEIQDAPGVAIYVRACDGEPIRVSRTAVGVPVATISLSGHALTCLLAGTEPPAEDRTLVTGDVTSVDMFLQWTARAQGLTLADA